MTSWASSFLNLTSNAWQMLKGPEGTQVSIMTDGGSATVPRDSNCSLGPAASGPAAPAPMGPMGVNFSCVPGTAMTPQECAALGVPPGTKWSDKSGGEPTYNGGNYGGSNAGESFLSI